jgi:hypothetical protein
LPQQEPGRVFHFNLGRTHGVFEYLSAFGLSASAGLNAYIPLLVVSLLAKFTDLIHLKEPWNALTSWWIIGLLIILTVVEIIADKVPAVNHINDLIQSFIRPTAGAIIFAANASIITEVHPVLSLAMGLFVAGGVHAVKALAVRPAVSATTAGAGNTPVSIAEDITATIVSILSVVVPVFVACLLVLITAWIIWFFWRRSKRKATQK